LLDDFVGLNSF